jgi:hypothetical protein
MKNLEFGEDGVCRIFLAGLPESSEIEELIEDYVTKVELLPYPLRIIFLDISELVHMQVRPRQVFSELLTQASRQYAGKIQIVIAGGPPMIQKFTEILCKAIGFADKTHAFTTLEEGETWAREQLKNGGVDT